MRAALMYVDWRRTEKLEKTTRPFASGTACTVPVSAAMLDGHAGSCAAALAAAALTVAAAVLTVAAAAGVIMS